MAHELTKEERREFDDLLPKMYESDRLKPHWKQAEDTAMMFYNLGRTHERNQKQGGRLEK